MPETVFDRVQQLLQSRGVAFDVLRHEPVFTSEQAAQVRGVALASGAKALICKADERFLMFVLPANLRLANRLIRKVHGIRKLRFASVDEVLALTGLQPGSIPPFGSLFSLETWCDRRLAEQPRINFNAGDHSISVSLTFADYFAAEQPTLAEVAEAAGQE